jgi:hypothetical protein
LLNPTETETDDSCTETSRTETGIGHSSAPGLLPQEDERRTRVAHVTRCTSHGECLVALRLLHAVLCMLCTAPLPTATTGR